MGFALERPCGRCLTCRINRADEWALRFQHELEDKTLEGDFITLTFDDKKCCPLLPIALSKRILQTYFKRLRKAGNRIKYFACGEYGGKIGRAHYHAIVIRPKEQQPNYEKHWKMGNVEVGTVTTASLRYVTGYLVKDTARELQGHEFRWPPFQLQSQGVGLKFAKQFRHSMNEETRWTPKYYRTKVALHERPKTELPTRWFTTDKTLNQRRLNTEAQRNCQEK